LLIFGLEEKAAFLRRVIFGTTEFDQMSAGGNALDADTSGEDIIQGNDKKSLAVKILSFSLNFAYEPEDLSGSPLAGANGAFDIPRPNRRCLRSCPVNPSEAGAQSWAESGKDAGPHGRTMAAPTPGIGRPVLINVVSGLRAFRTKIFHDQVNGHFLSLLHRTAAPLKSAAAVDKADAESGLAFGRARLRHKRAGAEYL